MPAIRVIVPGVPVVASTGERWTARHDSRWRLATRILLGVAVCLIVWTVDDYGMTWDEEHSANNGLYWIQWYASGFTERGAIEADNQRLYGSFFNGLSRLIADRSPLGLYETGHLVTALFGWLALWAVASMGTTLMGARAGFFAALILLLTPGWYGHTFNNPKDVPFAVMFAAALAAMLSAYRSLPRPTAKQSLLIGGAVGLALGIRVGAIVLMGCYALLFGCWLYGRIRVEGFSWTRLLQAKAAFVPRWSFALAIAWLVMLPWWPYAQLNPLAHPVEALRESARFEWTAVVLYHGAFQPAQNLAWHYLPRWFSKTLPDYYGVIALGVALAIAVARLRGTPEPANRDLRAQLFFVALGAFGLPVAAVLSKAVMYDAYRHFLFAIPPLAVLTGCGVSWLMDRPSRAIRVAVLAPAAVSAILTVADMVRLHPYQTVYFNRLNKGLPGAFGRYETDYWGASHKEGLEWLAANYRTDAPPRSIRVANSAVELFTGYYIETGGRKMERFVSVPPDAPADVVLSIRRWNLHERYKGRIIHSVSRMNVPLLHIIEPSRAD